MSDTGEALLLSVVLAFVLVAAFGKPISQAISGLMTKKKGKTSVTFWPVQSKSKGKRKKKRR